MSTFSQWRVGFEKTKTVRQFNYICGSESVLVEDIVRALRAELNPEPWNLSQFVVGEDSERLIWNDMNQFPMGKGNRLVLIRGAERIKNWNPLMQFMAKRSSNPRTHVILVSNEERIPRIPHPEDKDKTVLPPHLDKWGTKGHQVECRPFTQETAKHAVAWVQSKAKIREGIAGHLLDRADGDLRLVRDTCEKLAVFPGDATLTTVNGLLEQVPRDSFSDALMALDKKTALAALAEVPVSDYSRTIGFLDSRLDLAGMVHDMLAQMKNVGEITRAAGNKNFLVRDVIPVAKHYEAKRRQRIRRVLALADEALRDGATDGVLETVVAYW